MDDIDERERRHYVYTLAYPDERVFYVGKGIRDRILQHEYEARQGVRSKKCDIIREIWSQGGEVIKRKVAFFDTDEEALAYEQKLISSLDGLVNIMPGSQDFSGVQLSLEDQRLFGQSIRRLTANGEEYWSAREMANFLGYNSWQAFRKVVSKAARFLGEVGIDGSQHITSSTLSILIGRDALRDLDDVRLSRIGFLLVLQNADPSKVMVAIGKHYISTQAMRAAMPHEGGLRDSDLGWAGQGDRVLLSYRSRQKLRQPEGTKESIPEHSQANQLVALIEARRQRIEAEDRLGLFAQLLAPDAPDNGGTAPEPDVAREGES